MKQLILLGVLLSLIEVTAWAGQGWYLIFPPVISKDEKNVVDFSAPLSYWEQHSAYDSANQCEKALHKTQLQWFNVEAKNHQ